MSEKIQAKAQTASLSKPKSWASGETPVQMPKKRAGLGSSAFSLFSMQRDRYDRRIDKVALAGLQASTLLKKGKHSVDQITEKVAGKMMDRLDKRGVLDQKDKNGVTVRDHLKELDGLIEAQRKGENVRIPEAFRPLGQRADHKGGSLLKLKLQIIKDLDMPHRIRQGRNTLTCGPATAQAALARTSPGEYLRMGKELAIKGQTETAGGKVLKFEGKGFGDLKVGRSLTEDLFQPAMASMARAEWPAKGGEGDFGGLRFGPTRRFGGGYYGRAVRRFAGGEGGGEALTPEQYGGLMRAMVPGNQTPVDVRSDGQRRSLSRQVAAALQVGPVAVGLQGGGLGGTGHAVQVLDISPSFGSFFVSRGAPAFLNVTYHDPMVGEVQMPAKDFFKNVVHVTLPASLGNELSQM
ncbi:MAG: hypothetical protein VKO21_07005 [Candidatus Sericytochromatia bacterium]|nr:hypothetical protein [Candidatus Sericytochromatia bacterium]